MVWTAMIAFLSITDIICTHIYKCYPPHTALLVASLPAQK